MRGAVLVAVGAVEAGGVLDKLVFVQQCRGAHQKQRVARRNVQPFGLVDIRGSRADGVANRPEAGGGYVYLREPLAPSLNFYTDGRGRSSLQRG